MLVIIHMGTKSGYLVQISQVNSGGRIRYDFQKTISELFVDEFIKGIQEWAKQNKLLSRVQGYGMLSDPLMMLGYSDIPETEQLYAGGMINFLKVTGSATTLYGHQIATAESMVWMKREYMTTPLKWRVAADKLFEAGINQMIYHGFPYQDPNTPYPGFHPFSTPIMPTTCFSENNSRNNPFWKFYPVMNAYVGRMQYLLRRSKTSCKVGIYYGLFDYPNGYYKEEELNKGILNKIDTQMPPNRLTEIVMPTKVKSGDRQHILEMAYLGDKLVANGYYYAHVNEDRLLAASIKKSKLCIGDAELEALIFVNEPRLSIELVKKLEEIASAGIPVIFQGKLPTQQLGYLNHESNDLYIAQSIQSITEKMHSLCATDTDVINYLQKVPIEPYLRYSTPRSDLGFIFKQDREDQYQYLFIRNRKDQMTSVDFMIPSMRFTPFIFDAWHGECYQLTNYQPEAGGLKILLKLEPYESIMIGFGPQETVVHFPPRPKSISSEQGKIYKILTNWTLSLQERNIDGTFRDINQTLPQLVDWRFIKELKYCSGPAIYRSQFDMDEQELTQYPSWILRFQRVCDAALIKVNDHELPVLLVPPWQHNIGQFLKAGSNIIEIELYTTIRNRLVGYGNSGDKRYKQFKKGFTMPTGIIDPIMLVGISEKSN